MKILLIEDEEELRNTVREYLTREKFIVECAEDYASAMEKVNDYDYDCILLDIMLPGEDGLSILSRIRENPTTEDIPVIMLTAKSSELDKIVGLDKGADDYIVKPFSVLELVARVKAVLRRARPKEEGGRAIAIDGVVIDNKKRTVLVNGEPITLTYKEFELLYYLFRNKNIVLNRETIMAQVWGYDFEGESRTVDVHIASLRHKLKDKASLIETVRNIGYKVGYKE